MPYVIEPGSAVSLGPRGDREVSATVLAVCIESSGRVTYRCAWWDGRQLKQEWLDDILVYEEEKGTRVLKVGFTSGATEGKPT